MKIVSAFWGRVVFITRFTGAAQIRTLQGSGLDETKGAKTMDDDLTQQTDDASSSDLADLDDETDDKDDTEIYLRYRNIWKEGE